MHVSVTRKIHVYVCYICYSFAANSVESEGNVDGAEREFDFLVGGELLWGSLETHIAQRKISTVSWILLQTYTIHVLYNHG